MFASASASASAPTAAVRTESWSATPSWPKATESSAAATTEPWACATARATILDVDERASAITIQTDRDDTITLPRRYLDDGHVQLGYAMTGHSSQSLTVERAFVLAPEHGEQLEWGYVALSRARRATRIYVTEAALKIETHAPDRDRPDGLNRLARALAAPSARPLAHRIDRDHSIGLEL